MEEQQLSDRLDLERWLRIARQRWWVILGCAVLVAASAAAFSLSQTKQYTAGASLFFSQTQVSSELGLPTSTSNATTAQVQEDNVKLVESSAVAVRVSSALRGKLSPEAITSKVSITAQGQSDFVAVHATDTSPTFAAQLANVYAQQFIAFRRDTNRAAVTQVRDALQAQLNGMTPKQRASPAGTSLQARIEQLNTLAAAQTGDVQLVQPAGVPSSPSSPKTKRNIALGLVLGLLLGVGLAVLLDRLNRRVRNVDELGEIYGLPILAEVPESGTLVGNGQPKVRGDYEYNSFDMLRARLRYFNANKVKTLLVTSCAPQEGKTTVAWNLAEATVVTGSNRVLLIEADLRRPSMAAAHGLDGEQGLSDFLSEQCDYIDAVQKVDVATSENGHLPHRALDVLVAGPVPPNPAELIESARMKDLIHRVAHAYDFVIIDTGPALVVPDALALVAEVAGVLIVSHVEGTTRDAAAQLRDQLRAVKAPVVGVVANRVRESNIKSYYHGYGTAN